MRTQHTTNMEIQETILQQLGGNTFLMMTGSKNLRGAQQSLTMDLTRNKIGAKYLTITLEADDTYTMTFQSMRKFEIKTKAHFTDVYAEQLASIFESTTGLYVSL